MCICATLCAIMCVCVQCCLCVLVTQAGGVLHMRMVTEPVPFRSGNNSDF